MNRGAKVFYSGRGYVEQHYDEDSGEGGVNQKVLLATERRQHRGFFVTGTDFTEDLQYFGMTTICDLGFIYDNLPRGIIPRWSEHSVFVITDKDGNPDPFEIVKGQDIYRHDNGNALRIYWNDDAPPVQQDVAPTEKELSKTENRATLNIIYGLLDMLKKSGKTQNEIIRELEKFDYFGMSESNLKKLFAKANDIKKREH